MSGPKKINTITNLGTLLQAIFADLASVIRVSEAGLDWAPIGALTNAVRVGENTPIRVFNSAGATGYVSFGVQAMAAPTGPTDGIPIPAGTWIVVNSGGSPWVRGSAATVFGYKADTV